MNNVADIHLGGKTCPHCKQYKAAEDYTVVKKGPRKGHLVSWCKVCRAEATKNTKQRDPSTYRRIEWPSKLRRIYGIEPEDYYNLLAAQGGGCAICGTKMPKNKRTEVFSIDHCHQTGVVRGLLCTPCNRGLGLFEDDSDRLRLAANYIENYTEE